jgi:glycosyltransferase involved in cell wall biosynthesis
MTRPTETPARPEQASASRPDFIIIEPLRTSCDYYARPLDRLGRLRALFIGTRRGVEGVRPEVTRLKPAFGLVAYAAAKVLPDFHAESVRFRLHPWLDGWAKSQMRPGEHVLSSYGYANACFAFARQTGGRTFLDAGNSHPDHFWTVLSEELRRWHSPYPPVARHHYDRARAMLEHTDFILAPSSFVAQSFLDRGFPPDRVLRNSFPVNLECFSPPAAPRPRNRPLTIISTGRPSLRKGTPYLLEAFQLVRRRHPTARLLLTRECETNIAPVLAKFRDLPIEWSPSLPHPQLAERLRGADVFVLPSLEDGFAVTVAEALACGLPVITTPNTGASDLIAPGRNGEIVPIRDARAIAEAVLAWGDRVVAAEHSPVSGVDRQKLSAATFEQTFLGQLAALGV